MSAAASGARRGAAPTGAPLPPLASLRSSRFVALVAALCIATALLIGRSAMPVVRRGTTAEAVVRALGFSTELDADGGDGSDDDADEEPVAAPANASDPLATATLADTEAEAAEAAEVEAAEAVAAAAAGDANRSSSAAASRGGASPPPRRSPSPTPRGAALAAAVARLAGPWHVVRLTSHRRSRPVPSDFVSVSLEVPFAHLLLAQPAYMQLLANLHRVSGGDRGPNVRVGGNSGEQTVFLAPGAQAPPRTRYTMTAADVRLYAAALPLCNCTLTVSLSMRAAGDHGAAVAHARALAAELPPSLRASLCVGLANEPDRFPSMRYRKSLSLTGYTAEAAALFHALDAAGVAPECIDGPGAASAGWARDLVGYATRPPLGPRVKLLDFHSYGMTGCPRAHVAPTIPRLLSEAVLLKQVKKFAPLVHFADRLRRRLVIGEGNSCSCSGRAGVSDTMGAALWTADALLSHAATGVSRFNLHGGINYPYNSVTFAGHGAPPDVRPGYVGAFVVTLATRRQATFVDAFALRAAARPPPRRARRASAPAEEPMVKTHALRDASGAVRVVAIHKGFGGAAVTVRVLLPPGGVRGAAPPPPSATLVRVRPPAGADDADDAERPFRATKGITIAGMTFDGTTDGRLLGGYRPEAVPLCAFPLTQAAKFRCHRPPRGDAAAAAAAAAVSEADDGVPRGYEFLLRPAEMAVLELSEPAAVEALWDGLRSGGGVARTAAAAPGGAPAPAATVTRAAPKATAARRPGAAANAAVAPRALKAAAPANRSAVGAAATPTA